MSSSPCTIISFLDSSRTPTLNHIQKSGWIQFGKMSCSCLGKLSFSVQSSTRYIEYYFSSKCLIPSTTLSGCKSLGVLLVRWKVFWAFQIKRPRFTGSATWKQHTPVTQSKNTIKWSLVREGRKLFCFLFHFSSGKGGYRLSLSPYLWVSRRNNPAKNLSVFLQLIELCFQFLKSCSTAA